MPPPLSSAPPFPVSASVPIFPFVAAAYPATIPSLHHGKISRDYHPAARSRGGRAWALDSTPPPGRARCRAAPAGGAATAARVASPPAVALRAKEARVPGRGPADPGRVRARAPLPLTLRDQRAEREGGPAPRREPAPSQRWARGGGPLAATGRPVGQHQRRGRPHPPLRRMRTGGVWGLQGGDQHPRPLRAPRAEGLPEPPHRDRVSGANPGAVHGEPAVCTIVPLRPGLVLSRAHIEPCSFEPRSLEPHSC